MTAASTTGWNRWTQRAASVAIILLAAGVAMIPQKIHGYSCGHDFDFHLVSWFEVQSSWRHGLFYPHWAVSPNYGAGEPRFVFYPPITWMLGAALRFVVGWGYVPIALAWLLLAGTGLATRALARQVLTEGAATLAGCTAIFSGYALFTAYERSAFGELTGGVWIPLLVLFAFRDRNPNGGILQRAFDGSAVPLIFVVAGTWLSDVPLGVMVSYLMAAVALVAAVLRRSWAPVIRATSGAVVGIGLTCFYLVPAALEQKWVDVAQATHDPGSRVENSWLFARHSDPALELHDTVLLMVSIIAATMLAVAFGSLAIAWFRGKTRAPSEWWLLLAVIPVAILFLQFPVSLPIWKLLPKLEFIQFPWRWMVALEAPMGIFFAAAIWPARRLLQGGAAVFASLIFAAATFVAGHLFLQGCEPEDSVSGRMAAYAAGAGFEGTDEYEPTNADDSIIPTGLPGACLVADRNAKLAPPSPDTNPIFDASQHTCEGGYTATWEKPEKLHVAGDVTHSGFLILKLEAYPAWQVTVNGSTVTPFLQREDGLTAVPVSQGPVNVDVRWITLRDAVAGRALSLAALCLLTIAGWLDRRTPQPHLS